MPITVRVARLGSQVRQVEVSDNATVKEALEKAGESNLSNVEIRVNGEKTQPSTPLRDEAVITLIPQIKGG